jgi:hypothetical protein
VGERDPISETRYRLLKHGTDEEKEKAETVLRRENWIANVYVVNDPVNTDNNGQMKLLRFGKQLHKIIMDAIEGEDADEFGAKIFDLSKNGCNLKIKVERQGEFPTYVSSRFAAPSKVTGLTDSKVDDVYESITDLETVFPAKSFDELKSMLDEHFYCSDNRSSAAEDVWKSSNTSTEDDPAPAKTDVDSVDPLDDDKVKELLDGLGDE